MNQELSRRNKFLSLQNLCKKLLFAVSVASITLLLSNIGTGKQRLFSIILSFLISIFVTFKFNILDKIFKEHNKLYTILSIFFTLPTGFFFGQLFYSYNIIVEPIKSIFIYNLSNYYFLFAFSSSKWIKAYNYLKKIRIFSKKPKEI